MHGLMKHRRGGFWRTLCSVVIAIAAGAVPFSAFAQIDRAPYAPFESLIGVWEVSDGAGGPPFAIHRFRWSPSRSYILHSGSILINGAEQPQFEGMLMWNGVERRLDVLISTDLRYGLSQQQGSIRIGEDGVFVREIQGIFSPGVSRGSDPPAGQRGAIQDFRQTYRVTEPGRMLTSVMRHAGERWEPTHPGSESWVMVRISD